MKANVTQIMVEEHKLILRMVTLVEQNTARLEEGTFRNWQFYLDAVDFIRNYADRFHHAKEEDILFVALIKNGMPEKQSPIEAMHMEHDEGRSHVRAIEEAAQKALAGETGRLPSLWSTLKVTQNYCEDILRKKMTFSTLWPSASCQKRFGMECCRHIQPPSNKALGLKRSI